ncbi:zinc finger protein 37 homolog [Hyposmocoma kahamanoa]|uniref:zinc finger protein 37 homolog n=1 Tax=Hyposmocoma kahamanoa TaxID=1477025 RepID=UPI000E6D80DF|nr:zinc finger protein 37 homolog [Hyposmocoma kahamanoa]
MYGILKFKSQVKRAHELLVSYMLHHSTTLPTLSSLKTFTNQSLLEISYPEHNTEQPENLEIDTQHSTNESNNVGEIKYDKLSLNLNKMVENINSTNAVINNISKAIGKKARTNRSKRDVEHDEAEPLAFIKVEDQDNGVDHLEGYYVDENLDDVRFDDDDDEDKDLKAVLKSDPFQCTSTKSNGRRRRKTKAEYNDSDDEPLTLKKSKIAKCALKSQTEGPKQDRRKNPGPKREKPAGVIRNARVNRKLEQLGVPTSALEMVVLSWEEVEAERAKSLRSETFTRHEYRCYDCAVGFNHRAKLEDHMVKHSQAAGAAECSVCRVRCRDAHALAAHRRRHRVRWRCCRCQALWSRAAVGADHFARAHAHAPAVHRCSVCGHREPTLGKLRNHLKNHAERQKCELCGKTFRDRTSLRTHLFIHKGEKEHECPSCGKRFLFKKAMEVHMITHDAHAHLYCHQCDMNFKNRMSFYQHMKYNLKHIDPAKLKFACALCGKKFAKARRLQEHHLAVHLKATPERCREPGCAFACASRPVLRTHVRMVHRDARACRNHVCHACGKAYTTKKTLEGHLRSHTGERPLRCTACPATFRYEAALYNHNKLVHLKPKTGRNRSSATTVTQPAPAEVQSTPTSTSQPAPCSSSAPAQVQPTPPAPAWQITLNVPHTNQMDVS